MRTRLRRLVMGAWLVAALCLLAPSPAWAQLPVTGTIDANGETATFVARNTPSTTISLTGTFVGTLTFYVDPGTGTCSTAVLVSTVGSAGTASTATAAGSWKLDNVGYDIICVTSTAWTSGTATVTFFPGFGGSSADALGAEATIDTTVGLRVFLFDDANTHITSFGGFAGYAEDAIVSSGNTVIPPGFQRDDTVPTAECAEGDWCFGKVDGIGQLYVHSTLYDDAGTAIDFASETATPVVALDNDETEDEISDTSGCLAALFVGNRDTTPVFVKVFLADADDVTVGMTVPNMVFMVPSNSTDGVAGNVMPPGVCIAYTTGLSIATVTDEADAASTGPGANEVVLTAFIKT